MTPQTFLAALAATAVGFFLCGLAVGMSFITSDRMTQHIHQMALASCPNPAAGLSAPVIPYSRPSVGVKDSTPTDTVDGVLIDWSRVQICSSPTNGTPWTPEWRERRK